MKDMTMPGKDEEQMIKEIMEDYQERDWYDNVKPKDIWVSPDEKEKINTEAANEKARKQLEKVMREYQQQDKLKPKSDVERLRDEMMREIRDIKKAIHILGILLESDEPSREDLEKHKTLREAYRKYKMIEALTLGQNENNTK